MDTLDLKIPCGTLVLPEGLSDLPESPWFFFVFPHSFSQDTWYETLSGIIVVIVCEINK